MQGRRSWTTKSLFQRAARRRCATTGAYRIFAELERQAGGFPARQRIGPTTARSRRHGVVLERLSRHGPAPQGARRDARDARQLRRRARAARATSRAPRMQHVLLERELADLHGKEAALIFTSRLCLELGGAVDARRAAAGLRRAVRRAQPRLDDRGHPPQPRRVHPLRATTTPRISTAAAAELDAGRAQAGRVRERLFDGRRHRPDRRDPRRLREARRDVAISTRSTRVGLYGPRGGGIAERDGLMDRIDRDRGHAGQGVRRDGRLYRRVGTPVRFRPQLRQRASSSRPRCRRRSPPARPRSIRHLKAKPDRARAPSGPRRRSSAGGSTRSASRCSTIPATSSR